MSESDPSTGQFDWSIAKQLANNKRVSKNQVDGE